MNAAMKEFAQKGFKNASTDEIVKEAAISKGSLFHYFNNKKDLFLFLYDYAIDIMKKDIFSKFDNNEKDFFKRLRQLSLLKFEIWKRHPYMYNFVVTAYMEDLEDIKGAIEKRNKGVLKSSQGFIYEGIDTSKFKEGVDVQKVIDIITWTIEGFTNREMGKTKNVVLEESDFDELFSQIDSYLELFRTSFFK